MYIFIKVQATVLLVFLISVTTLNANAAVIYEQAADLSEPSNTVGSSTVFDPGPKTLDNFSLGNDAVIRSVEWYGSFFSTDPGAPSQNTIDGFLIEFWADINDEPGTLVFSQSISGNAGQQLESGSFQSAFKYSAELGPGFTADAGITYWLMIQAQLEGQPHWGWLSSPEGDDKHCAFQGPTPQVLSCFSSGPILIRDADRAFSLHTSIAEPDISALMALALVGIAYNRRRQRRNQL